MENSRRNDQKQSALGSIARLLSGYCRADRIRLWCWVASIMSEAGFAALVCGINVSMAEDFGWTVGIAVAIALVAALFGHSASAVVFHTHRTPGEAHKSRMRIWAAVGLLCAAVSIKLSLYRTTGGVGDGLSTVLCAVELTVAAVLGVIAAYASLERLQPGFLRGRAEVFYSSMGESLGARQTWAQELVEAYREMSEERIRPSGQRDDLRINWLKRYTADIRRVCPFPVIIDPDDEANGHKALLDTDPRDPSPARGIALSDFARLGDTE